MIVDSFFCIQESRVTNGDDAKKRKRREEEEFLKKAQALFFIETRCRLDDVMVRMDLQLYSIDSENYLVDFRNVGYKLLQESPLPTHSANMLRRGSVEDVSPCWTVLYPTSSDGSACSSYSNKAVSRL